MTHLWIRAESRANEERVGILPNGVAELIDAGLKVTIEESPTRIIPLDGYVAAGANVAPEGSWETAPEDAIIFGLKELPETDSPLAHKHIMFGHAFKGQFSGQKLLQRFKAGGGSLFDLEYLVDDTARRVAAFGYWAGYAGAAVTLFAWAAQKNGAICGPVDTWRDAKDMRTDLRAALDSTGADRPNALVIGALGRVGGGASALCQEMDVEVTKWDMAETQSGGPFPEILAHDLFFNCILAGPGVPVFVPKTAIEAQRTLSAIGDIACDPDSDYNPVPVYSEATSWAAPALRVAESPVLDVMAIDNLPSLLPRESSEDFASQLLPHLKTLVSLDQGVWGRAHQTYLKHLSEV